MVFNVIVTLTHVWIRLETIPSINPIFSWFVCCFDLLALQVCSVTYYGTKMTVVRYVVRSKALLVWTLTRYDSHPWVDAAPVWLLLKTNIQVNYSHDRKSWIDPCLYQSLDLEFSRESQSLFCRPILTSGSQVSSSFEVSFESVQDIHLYRSRAFRRDDKLPSSLRDKMSM